KAKQVQFTQPINWAGCARPAVSLTEVLSLFVHTFGVNVQLNSGSGPGALQAGAQLRAVPDGIGERLVA
ncbi:hypothetical protein EJB05_49022, partial [Eragrostis curvula]